MRNSKNFVIFNHSGVIGGGEQSLLTLLQGIDFKRYDPLLVFPKGPYEKLVKNTKARYRVLNVWLLRIKTIPLYILTLIRLFLILRRERPYFVYCNSILSCQWGLPLGFALRKPVIVHFRDWDLGPASRLLLKLFPYFSVANSKAVLQKMVMSGYMDEKKSFMAHNGVDLQEFSPDPNDKSFRSDLGVENGEFLVGIVGRIDPWKGHEDFVKAALVLNDIPNMKWVIVGDTSWTSDPKFAAKLTRLISKWGLGNKVVFSGFRYDMVPVYRGLDLVVAPSCNEPFGRNVIEAMACGTPVVGSNSGGIPEIIEDGKSGILVPPGEVKVLASVVKKLYVDRKTLDRISKNGVARVKKHFSSEKYCGEMQKVFDKIVR